MKRVMGNNGVEFVVADDIASMLLRSGAVTLLDETPSPAPAATRKRAPRKTTT